MVHKDEIKVERDNGPFIPLLKVSVNGVHVGRIRELSNGKWITRGSFAGYVYGSVDETYYPSQDEAVQALLFGYYRNWVKRQNLTVTPPQRAQAV
jgi:hypothetical protein